MVPDPELSLILPCYNERGILEESVREVRSTLDGASVAHEIIFVDDASSDGTPGVIAEILARHGEEPSGGGTIRAILHRENRGRGASVMDGFGVARGAIVGYIDVDLETHCRHIPALLEAIRGGADGAVARRQLRVTPGRLHRHVLSRGYNRLVRGVLGLPFRDTEAGFKFFRRSRLAPLLPHIRSTGWFWDTEVMALGHAAGLEIVEVPCPFVRRSDHPSSVRPVRDSLAYLRALLAFRARVGREGAWTWEPPALPARGEGAGTSVGRPAHAARPAGGGVGRAS